MHGPALLALSLVALVTIPTPPNESSSGVWRTSHASHRAPNTGAADVVITATDFAFDAPAHVPSGRVTLRLVNKGQQVHHALFLRVEEKTAVGDVTDALKTNDWTPPWMRSYGGPEGVAPGGEGTVTVTLDPGRYFVACIISSPGTNKKHFMDGMVREIIVDSTPAPAAPPVSPNATVTMREWAFDVQGTLKPGHQVIRVQNYGLREHHLQLVKLLPGRSLADAMAWSENPVGPVPYHPVSGTTGLGMSRKADIDVELEAGEYALLCTLNDPLAHVPHTAHGMAKLLTVQ